MIPKQGNENWNLQQLMKQDMFMKFVIVVLLYYFIRGGTQ